jgi:hypothetical protein
LETKIKKFENFFIPFSISTYGEKAVYNFVDFRIKPAYPSNYGGVVFYPRQKTAKK